MKSLSIIFLINMIIFNSMKAQENVREYIERKITGKETPGFQYIIADSSGILFEYNGGYANIGENIPVTAKTEFKAYSSTKTLTALAIMQLVEDGKISLDDEAGKLLNIPFTEPFTIRQLMSHTAGVTSTPLVTEIHRADKHAQFDVKANSIRLINKYQKLRNRPGKKKKYSNFGYLILGEIVEQVSGQSFTEYVTENIFNRLGKESAYGFAFNENTAKAYQKTSSVMHLIYSLVSDIKTYYDRKERGFMGYHNLYLNAYSYGGAFTNARSMLHYGQTLMKSGSPLLSDSSRELLFTEQLLGNGKPSGHTLGWFIKERKGVRYYSHPGGGGGYSCEIRIYPDLGIVSVFMMNTTELLSHLSLLNKLDSYFLE
jgi:D-alanyl-D-alanine carboxypeptidase